MHRLGGVTLICLILAAPLLAGRISFASFGAYPHNDDFLYARCSQILVDEGRYQHVTQYGSLTASVAGHSIWGALVCLPLGFSYSNLHLAVAFAAWLGSLCVYVVGRRFHASRGTSLLIALAMTVGPYYYGMSFSFMTDVTAVAYLLGAVLLYTVGVQRCSPGYLLGGALAASAAMWTRQTHLVVIVYPLVALVGARTSLKLTAQRLAMLVTIAAGLPLISYLVYDMGWLLPGNDNRMPRVGVRRYDAAFFQQAALYVYQATILTGMVLIPLLPLMVSRMPARVADLAGWRAKAAASVSLGTLLALLGLFAVKGGRIYLTQATGYILTNAHLGPILLADQMDPGRWSDMGGVRWPPLFWQALTIASFVAIACLVWWIAYGLLRFRTNAIERIRHWCFLGLLFALPASLLGMLVTIETLYDRYWMLFYPFVFPALALLLAEHQAAETTRVRRSASFATTGVLCAAMFALSFVFTHDFLAWNQQRGKQVDRWLTAGLQPVEFDAGNGINGWYRTLEDFDTHKRPGDPTLYWRGHARVALSIGPRPGWRIIDRLKWDSWAVRKECEILVLRRESPHAPPGP